MTDLPPTVRPPTASQIRAKAAKHHMTLSDEEVALFAEFAPERLEPYARLERLPDRSGRRAAGGPREGYRPDAAEDPYNAYVTKCEVRGEADGPLSGYRVGLKDSIALAGIELTCGSNLLQGYVPTHDATVTRRLLDAGATIVGKMNMDDMAYSGSGEMTASGPVLNPRDDDYLAGGSSGGCAAAVVAGDVDIAIGTDQGGSNRRPAAWCGCVGVKPTHGFVPYTGIVGIGHTFDHVGPLARTVRDCALALDVVAGPDPLDPRQCDVPVQSYAESLPDDPSPSAVSVGTIEEGFGLDPDGAGVDRVVRTALSRFEGAGASVEPVSVALHLDGSAIWTAINREEFAALLDAEGVGHFVQGFYDTDLVDSFGPARRTRADDLPASLKLSVILGQYLADEYHGRFHAKAQNLRRDLAAAYDRALAEVDVLAVPTIQATAKAVPEELTKREVLGGAIGMVQNRAPFNVSGHPVVSVPCGTHEGLPVGLSLVGERGDDATVLRAAHTFERTVDWEAVTASA